MAVSPAAAQADAAAAQARAQLRAAEEQYSALLEEARTTEARAAQARAAVQVRCQPMLAHFTRFWGLTRSLFFT
jgi:F0F1-type ATP synthase membrane subunit b/b'